MFASFVRIFLVLRDILESSRYASLVNKVWLVVLRINVDLAIFKPYLDLEAGEKLSLKIQVARPPQAKSLTTRPPLLPSK